MQSTKERLTINKGAFKMRVQATKTMANEINKAFKSDGRFAGYLAKWQGRTDFWGNQKT